MRALSLSPTMPLLLLLLAGGCSANSAGYPSLAPRAIEKIDVGVAPAPVPAAPLPVDPVLEAKVAEHLRAARAADAAFDQALAIARQAAAGAGAPGSESWIDAQQKLSVVQQARTAMVSAIANLDALRIAEAQRGTANIRTLDAAWDEASALDRRQSAQLETLSARLASP